MTAGATTTEASTYLRYLPAIFRVEDRENGGFLGRFLLAFEAVLTGRQKKQKPGLEELLDGIVNEDGTEGLAGVHRYFDPGPGRPDPCRAPNEFLEWLASFVALTLRADTSPEFRRDLIARAVPLYRRRGTLQGLADMLTLLLRVPPTIEEYDESFQIFDPASPSGVSSDEADRSQIGVGTWLGGGPAHCFEVTLRLPAGPDEPDAGGAGSDYNPHAESARLFYLAGAIIDREKPAHTSYTLQVIVPQFQIVEELRPDEQPHSRIGVDTLIRSAVPDESIRKE
jgi:phage tail-like protein